MKNIHLLLLPLVFWASCQDAKAPPMEDSPSLSDSLRRSFIPMLKGEWVAADYLDSVAANRSPHKSWGTLTLVELDFTDTTRAMDSLAFAALNIHEGTTMFVHFRKGTIPGALPLYGIHEQAAMDQRMEMSFDTAGKDTILNLHVLSRNGIEEERLRYIRVRDHWEQAFQFMLNRVLFSGKYDLLDSAGIAKGVMMDDDGDIKGLDEWSKYFILADFEAEIDSSFDQVGLTDLEDSIKWFAYTIEGDTLRVYENREDGNRNFLGLGQLKYTLIRKKN